LGKRRGSLENLELKKSFWKNKKVLITGNLGFKGSWLCLQLSFFNAKVFGLDNDSTNSSLLKKKCLKKYVKHQYKCDIRDLKKINSIVSEVRPDIIIHMAAQSLVISGLENPIFTLDVNIMGTANVIESAKISRSVKSILVVTSDKVYENNEKNKTFKENDKLGGDDPYSASKACADIISKSYSSSYFKRKNVNLATARAGNVIGGGDVSSNRLVPDIYRSIVEKKKLKIRNKNYIRPWQHVLDCNNGYMTLIEKLQNNRKYSGAWNFSTNNSDYTVQKICEEFTKNIFFKFIYSTSKHKEKKVLKLNSNKSKYFLSWKTQLSFKEMIKLTSEWYKRYLNGEDPDLICMDQINKYYLSK
jgi:CDP-glucose 4,6-dehydratase